MRTSSLYVMTALSALVLCQPAMAASKHSKSDADEAKYYDMKEAPLANDDPWEDFNRPIFSFNLGFDQYVAKPFISAYDVIPAPGRHRVSDFLSNLGEPLNFIHGVLQLNPKVAFTSLWRFILNTTFGLGGLRDFAGEDAGLHKMNENLGRTLGYWGAPTGPYVVLPILGPSSVRDTSGKVGDWFLDPIGWAEDTWTAVGQAAADGIDSRDRNAGVVEHLYYESLDPYVATRSAYRQHEIFKEKQ